MTATSGSNPESSGPDASALARRLRGLNLYLVGMMGAGKSAVGRPLAEALGYRFLDADRELEKAAGCSIAELFASQGEEGFRTLETATLQVLATFHSCVVATGGGVVTRPENWGQLRQGVVIWLDAPAPMLLERLRADPTPRPLLQHGDPAARLRELLEQRRPLYAEADLTLRQQGEPPAAVAERILEALPAILRQPEAPPDDALQVQHQDGRTNQSIN
ncbi:MAG: shikimate kinase [Synechococcaceae cyanobacterium]|nr:shikimate kinase [Synechococcaceae cyanobacterium]